MATFPFNALNDFYLNLMLQLQHNLGENSIFDEQYERDTSNAINNNSEEIEYTCDDYNNLFVKSRYLTQNQFISNSQFTN